VEVIDPIFIRSITRDETSEWSGFLKILEVGTDENVIRKLV